MDSGQTKLSVNHGSVDNTTALLMSQEPAENGVDTEADEVLQKKEVQEEFIPTDNENGTSCGVGAFRPKWLQWFSRIGAFVGFYSTSALVTSTLIVYVNSQISMLEKQFGFSSQQSGVIMACNDIGFLCTVIFAGHIARKVHIPRGLFVCTILYGISGILCALPYFIQDKSVFDLDNYVKQSANYSSVSKASKAKRAPLCLSWNASDVIDTVGCGTSNSRPNAADLEHISVKKIAFILIAIGMVFQGVAKAPRSPFVTLFVDDAVDKRKTGFYMGIVIGTAIFGPALAYGLGGLFSKLYITLEEVEIGPRDPRWIGAWWLGFIVFGAISILVSFPLLCFPSHLKKDERIPMTEKKPKKKPLADMAVSELTTFLQSIFRVLRNPVYTLSVCGSCIHLLGIAGVSAFLAKYIEAQFTIPLWQANIVLAVCNILAVSLGAFFGGIVTRKINMTPLTTLRLLITLYVINILFYITGFFLGCDQPTVYGDNMASTRPDLYQPTGHNGSLSCVCDDQKYYPICGEDGKSYFSPCHAGCPAQDTGVQGGFQNCTSIPGGTAIGGLCVQNCNTLWTWAVLNFLGALIAAHKIMPKVLLTIRCVEERDRSMATALSSFMNSTIGWMLGPIVFGTFIDDSCVLWRYICTERQSCYMYDITFFRNVIYGVGTTTRSTSTLIHVIMYILVRNKKDWKAVAFRIKKESSDVKKPVE